MVDSNRWLGRASERLSYPQLLSTGESHLLVSVLYRKSLQVLTVAVYLLSEIQFLLKWMLKFLLTSIQPCFRPVTSPQYLHKQAWKMTLRCHCSSISRMTAVITMLFFSETLVLRSNTPEKKGKWDGVYWDISALEAPNFRTATALTQQLYAQKWFLNDRL